MNKIVLIGNLTRDPETRATPNGATVCSFTIAVNRRFAAQGADRQTDFFRINAWRQLGENCSRYLTKGKKVAVVGELQARTYEDKDGKTRMSLDVSADEVEFLSPKSSEEGYGNQSYSGGSQNRVSQPDTTGFADISTDDIPF